MKTRFLAFGLTGFGLTTVFAVLQEWSLKEFCWSTWLAGLVFSWTCVCAACIRIVITARGDKASYERALPFVRGIAPNIFVLGIAAVAVLIGLLAFYAYSYIFGFYGLFLSFFAEMEPHALFGRNGFINSDFYTPVAYLLGNYWPMAVATLVANWDGFLHVNPWNQLALPFRSHVILRVHLLIVVMPFLALTAWALFGQAYQPVTVVMLIGLFYLLPKPEDADEPGRGRKRDPQAGAGR